MGCCGSKDAPKQSDTYTSKDQSAHNSALDGPPDFGVDEYYEVRKLLGEGGSGQTWLCLDNVTRKAVAIKFIKRPIPRIVLPMLMHEIKIQAELGDGHVNLVSAKAVLLTDTHLGIVMEYASGGNLTAYVQDKWDTSHERDGLFLTEDEARYYFRQYMEAVGFLHQNHVAHRDLKLDNIVLDGKKPPRIKVCDFGFAKNWDEKSTMYTQIGTPVYMSPELIVSKTSKTGYDATKADIWACGVLLFVMLLGMFPYDHTEHPDPNSSDAHVEVWMQQIKNAWRDCPSIGDSATKLSIECQDLLDKMFDREEGRRITIECIKQHRWYRMPLPKQFQDALDDLRQEQTKVDELVQQEPYSPEDTEQRDRQLEELLQLAARDVDPAIDIERLRRVELTRVDAAKLPGTPRAEKNGTPASAAASPASAAAAVAQADSSPRPGGMSALQQSMQDKERGLGPEGGSSTGPPPTCSGNDGNGSVACVTDSMVRLSIEPGGQHMSSDGCVQAEQSSAVPTVEAVHVAGA